MDIAPRDNKMGRNTVIMTLCCDFLHRFQPHEVIFKKPKGYENSNTI
jgi:hypothetical protein